MLFASSFGEFVFHGLMMAILFLVFLFKIIAASDDDGTIKDTASKGIAAWIERWLK